MDSHRLNIGCGDTPSSGWINIDNSISIRLANYPLITKLLTFLKLLNSNQKNYIDFCKSNNIIWADVVQKIPFKDNSVEAIYTSHMLEHLDRDDARVFLLNAKKVLKPGGIFRISVPDFRMLIEGYMDHNSVDKFLEDSLLTITAPKTIIQKINLLTTGLRHHQWMYDSRSLISLLKDCGFINVIEVSHNTSNIFNQNGLNLEERSEESIYIECSVD
jgi:predicted SAM-dependent methyltransferase